MLLETSELPWFSCVWHHSLIEEVHAGTVDWTPHLPKLLTHIQWSFQVPVGGATAQSPIGAILLCSCIVVSQLACLSLARAIQ